MRKTLLFCAALLLAASSNSALGAPENYRRIGYLWTPGLEPAVSGLEEAMTGLGYPSALVKPALYKALAGELRNPNLRGVDLQRPLAVVLLMNEEEEPLPAYLVHLSDAKVFNQSVSRYFSGQVEDGPEGIRVFSREIEALDEEAFQRASPDERKNLSRFYLTRIETLAVADGEDWAWLSRRPEVLETLLDTTPSDLIPPVRSNLVAVLDIASLGDKLLQRMREELRDQKRRVPPEYFQLREKTAKFAEFCLRQVKILACGLDIDGQGFALNLAVAAESGSPLGEFLEIQRPGSLSLARYLDPASASVANYHLNFTPDWNRRITGFIRKRFSSLETEAVKDLGVTGEIVSLLAYPEETEEVEAALSLRAGGKDLFSFLSVIKLSPAALPPTFRSELFPVESVHREVEIRRFRPATEEAVSGEDTQPDPTPEIRAAAKKYSWRLASVKGLIVSEVVIGEMEGDLRPAIDRILDEKNLFDLDLLPPGRGSANCAFFVQPARAMAALINDGTPAQAREVFRKLDQAQLSLTGCALIKGGLIEYRSFLPIGKIKTLLDLFSQP